MQQPQRTEPTALDPHRLADLRQRPLTTSVPLDGKEKVYRLELLSTPVLEHSVALIRSVRLNGREQMFELH